MLTVGEILRQKREEKGLSIKTVVDSTYIQAKFIIALECNDYAAFPAEAYAKGFLKIYSELLELDASEMLELFKNIKGTVVPTYDQEYYKADAALEPENQKVEHIEVRRAIIQEARDAEQSARDELIEFKNLQETNIAVDNKTVEELPDEAPGVLIEQEVLAVLEPKPSTAQSELDELIDEASAAPVAFSEEEQVVVGTKTKQVVPPLPAEQKLVHAEAKGSKTALFDTLGQETSFRQKLAENRNNGKSGPPKVLMVIALLLVIAAAAYFFFLDKAVMDNNSSNAVIKTAGSNILKPIATSNNGPVKILEMSGRVTGRCWVSVVADGKTIFEDNLQPGGTFKWQANNSLKVTIGNVSALTDLKLNGQPANLGEVRNNVVEKTFYVKDLQ